MRSRSSVSGLLLCIVLRLYCLDSLADLLARKKIGPTNAVINNVINTITSINMLSIACNKKPIWPISIERFHKKSESWVLQEHCCPTFHLLFVMCA